MDDHVGRGTEHIRHAVDPQQVLAERLSLAAQARSPRALETIGIHLKIALGLSNEVGPPQAAPQGCIDPPFLTRRATPAAAMARNELEK